MSFAARAAVVLIAAFACASCSRRAADGPAPVVVALDAAPRVLDPRFATADVDVKLSRLIFPGLVTFDTPDGTMAFDLAASIDVPEPLRRVIHLRPGLRFHDGSALTSEDVAATFASLASESLGSPLREQVEGIEVRVIDDLTLELVLDEYDSSFAMRLELGILPAEVVATNERLANVALIGAGPFRFDAFEADGGVSMRSFEHFLAGAPPIAHLVFRVLPDQNARVLGLLGGTVDLAQNSIPPILLPAIERDDDLVAEATPSMKLSYVVLNLGVEPLDDLRVRRAIAMGIDRSAIVENRFRGAATLATGLLPPSHAYYLAAAGMPEPDAAAARTLLDEAGYTDADGDGCRFRLELKTSANRFYRSIAELLADQLAAIEVCVDVRSFEWGTFYDDVRSGNFEGALMQWPSLLDPASFEWIFHSRSIPTADNRAMGGNRGQYRNLQVDTLIDAARIEPDESARMSQYGELQTLTSGELPYLFLWHEDNLVVRNRRLDGYLPTPNARFRGLATARRLE